VFCSLIGFSQLGESQLMTEFSLFTKATTSPQTADGYLCSAATKSFVHLKKSDYSAWNCDFCCYRGSTFTELRRNKSPDFLR
jgi:hypothetical protein